MKMFVLVFGLIIVLVCIIGVILIVHFYKKRVNGGLSENDAWLVNEFKRCNVIVSGKKGSGKDLLFAHVIYLRGETHYSNIRYNGLTEGIGLTDIALENNTFENCIDGTITKLEPQFEEERDFYISDGGIYLSSQYDKELNTKYPSMPIFYALSRHFYNSNIHVNVQNLGRLWIKLREQADSYIRVLKTSDRGEWLRVETICYDNYNSANSGLLPNSDPQYKATHGEIKARTFKVYKAELEYNTRHFKDVFFNIKKNPLEEILSYVCR